MDRSLRGTRRNYTTAVALTLRRQMDSLLLRHTRRTDGGPLQEVGGWVGEVEEVESEK